MNPSTAAARVLVDELARGGVHEAVLAPGSRNAPLSVALDAADRAGRLRLHVRVDERTAGFLAVGLAKASGRPVPVCCTSGTAAANLHPAVLEAAHAAVPLLVLTADRPPELRGVGANQTADQLGLYGRAVREFVELGVPEARAGAVAYWRSAAARALAVAAGADPGPVHLNCAFRDPLLPSGGEDWVEPLDGRPGGRPWLSVPPAAAGGAGAVALAGRVLVVAGDGADPSVAAVAEAAGWPVLAEPSSGLWSAPTAVPHYELLLAAGDRFPGGRPDGVLVTGRPTLSRRVVRLLAGAPGGVTVLGEARRWADPARSAARLVRAVAAAEPAPPDWLGGWRRAAAAAAAALAGDLDGDLDGGFDGDLGGDLAGDLDGDLGGGRAGAPDAAGERPAEWPAEWPASLSGPLVARRVVAAATAGELLVVGSSQPIRDLAGFAGAPAPSVRVLANRGLAGIDGTVSTAVGAALAHRSAGGGPALALIGDLTLVHDLTGLVIGPGEPRPDLSLVVVNNAGGGIFALLEPGTQTPPATFERVFATPTGVDVAGLAGAVGAGHRRVTTPTELSAALAARPEGIRIVEAAVERRAARALQDRLVAAVVAAVAAAAG